MITLDYIAWQPIIELASNRIIGHEGLARFRHGLSPLDAFRSAGDNALLLDYLCLAEAFRRPPSRGWIFVNVTPAFVQTGAWLLPHYRLRSRVVWELPETPGWHPTHIPNWAIVALDDVGIGHAELIRVTQVPWRFLKVDQSLVQGIAHQPPLQQMVRELVHIAAHRRGVIIAEGIEQSADRQCLQDLGVTYGQGFLLGRPQPFRQNRGR